MKISVVSADTVEDLGRQLRGHPMDFLSVHGGCGLELAALADLADLSENVALHGATSCLGAMTHDGTTGGVAAFVLSDPDGTYGSALAPFGDDPASAARTATQAAQMAADRAGERPDIVWVASTPGAEEAVLAGIQSVIGADVPIIGGSAADNTLAGDWAVCDRSGQTGAGVVVSVLYPSRPVSFAYHNGYAPTPQIGTVTRVDGRRLQEIDGRPAFDVYSEWTGGAVSRDVDLHEPQPILSASTLWPLGREISAVGGVPHFLLAHPATAHPDGSIDLFASVDEGERLTLMTGTRDGLTARAGRVAALAREAGLGADAPISGALMIYCGGCMLTVRDRLPAIVAGVNQSLDGAPFLGAFTFGEQGAVLGAGNRHGNLMISCIVFG